MEKKQWIKPEIRQISRAEYWEIMYRDYQALQLERLERRINNQFYTP